jgi:hypothetical protein
MAATARKLTESQFVCLWALSIGSKGSASNARTLESLRRRGLAMVRKHQGEWLWEATAAGESLINADERAAL